MKCIITYSIYCIIILMVPAVLYAQSGDLKLLDWKPQSQLVVKETKILQPKFPVIDFHNHLGGVLSGFSVESTQKCLEEMDKAGVIQCVSLDAHSKNDFYKEHLRISNSVSKDRFLIFFVPDFSRIDEPDFGRTEAAKTRKCRKNGRSRHEDI